MRSLGPSSTMITTTTNDPRLEYISNNGRMKVNVILSKSLIMEEELEPLSLSVRGCDGAHGPGREVAVAAVRNFPDETL